MLQELNSVIEVRHKVNCYYVGIIYDLVLNNKQ